MVSYVSESLGEDVVGNAYIKFPDAKAPRNIADTSLVLYNRSTGASFMGRRGIGRVEILRWFIAMNPVESSRIEFNRQSWEN